MQQIKVKGKVLQVDYCGISWLEQLNLQVIDDRPLCEIAPDIENAETIDLYEDGEKIETYDGYIQMVQMIRIDQNHRKITLQKVEA